MAWVAVGTVYLLSPRRGLEFLWGRPHARLPIRQSILERLLAPECRTPAGKFIMYTSTCMYAPRGGDCCCDPRAHHDWWRVVRSREEEGLEG